MTINVKTTSGPITDYPWAIEYIRMTLGGMDSERLSGGQVLVLRQELTGEVNVISSDQIDEEAEEDDRICVISTSQFNLETMEYDDDLIEAFS